MRAAWISRCGARQSGTCSREAPEIGRPRPSWARYRNLDAKLRKRARAWVKELQHRLGLTTIFVTHDQDEALSMSDRVAVMSAGEVQEIGPPEAVYRRPANRFVAEFVGRVNLIEGVATRTDDGGDGLGAPHHRGSPRGRHAHAL